MVICHTFKWTKSPPTQQHTGMLIFPLFYFVHLLRTPFSSSLFLVTMHNLSPLVLMTKPLDVSLESPVCQIMLFSETFSRPYAPLFHFFSKLEGTIHSHLPWMPSRLLSLPEGPSRFLSVNYTQCRHVLPLPGHSCWPWSLEQYLLLVLLPLHLKSSGNWLPAWAPALAWSFPFLVGLAPRVWWQRALLLSSPLLPAGTCQGCHRIGLLSSRPWGGCGSTLASGPKLEPAGPHGWFWVTSQLRTWGWGKRQSSATCQSSQCSQEIHRGSGRKGCHESDCCFSHD